MGAWVGAALAGLSALSGGMGSQSQQSSRTTYDYDPQTLDFRNYLTNLFKSRMTSSPVFDNAYRMSGASGIRRNASNVTNGVDDLLTARGIGRTTAGASALRDTGYNAGMDMANFNNDATMTLDNRRGGILKDAGGFLQSLPVNTSTEGTIQGPNGFAGAVQGGASGLAGYLGQWSANKQYGDTMDKLMAKYPDRPIYLPR